MFGEGKKSLVNLIKECAPFYIHNNSEGVILDNIFKSFEGLSVKQLAKLIVSTEKIGYAHSQCRELAIGKEIFFGSLVDIYNPKKVRAGYCLDYELQTNNYYKEYCIITDIEHGWSSVADEMIENIRYTLDKEDKEKRLKELRTEWDTSIINHRPKKLAFYLQALTFEALLDYVKKNE